MSRLHDLEKQINDMLLFAKGDQEQVAQEISLQQLLTEVRAGSEAMICSSSGELETVLPEPDITILGNKNALASAIQNLIHNSLEVIGAGAEIKLSAYRDPQNEHIVSIEVSDNGPGLTSVQQQQVFEPFYTTRSKGTGLGLAVVKSVAEQHNGDVQVISEINKGATFKIRLPIINASQERFAMAVGQN
jgi:two-component system sensor histidine kinase FlrB